MVNIFEQYLEKQNYVKTDEYLDWIVEFSDKQLSWTNETILNKDIKETDKKQIELLSYFCAYVEMKANEQNIFITEEISYIIKIRKKFYNINKVEGPEPLIEMKKIEYDNTSPYVKMDEELTEQDILDSELIEYIIINKNLVNKISAAKIGVHIGHVCTIVAVEQSNELKFIRWYKNKESQKKVILQASEAKLKELSKDFYSVCDLGYTEVEPNTLIAVSLGILTRKEALPYVKRLQTWKN